MSAWSDAGWPSGIFFANPRAAINLLIDATNELLVATGSTPLSSVSELAGWNAIQTGNIDNAIINLIRAKYLMWDYDRYGTDRAGWYPTWIDDAVGGIPRETTIPSADYFLRWVISRYKILNNCNRFISNIGGYVERRGYNASSYKYFNSDAARATYVTNAMASSTFAALYTAASQFRSADGVYGVRSALCSRFRVRFTSTEFLGMGRYICACMASRGGVATFDTALAPVADGDLWWSPTSALIDLNAASVDAVFYDQYWTYPYSINPGTTAIDTGFNLDAKLAVDFSDRH